MFPVEVTFRDERRSQNYGGVRQGNLKEGASVIVTFVHTMSHGLQTPEEKICKKA